MSSCILSNRPTGCGQLEVSFSSHTPLLDSLSELILLFIPLTNAPLTLKGSKKGVISYILISRLPEVPSILAQHSDQIRKGKAGYNLGREVSPCLYHLSPTFTGTPSIILAITKAHWYITSLKLLEWKTLLATKFSHLGDYHWSVYSRFLYAHTPKYFGPFLLLHYHIHQLRPISLHILSPELILQRVGQSYHLIGHCNPN